MSSKSIWLIITNYIVEVQLYKYIFSFQSSPVKEVGDESPKKDKKKKKGLRTPSFLKKKKHKKEKEDKEKVAS